MNTPRVISIQIGKPQRREATEGDLSDKPWETAFYKSPIEGLVRVKQLGLEGDGQADLVNHGGADKAICVYPSQYIPYWREELGIKEIGPGAFGENFTVADLTEEEVCIGDIWRAGSTEVQVSQPRQPCWKLARRWQVKDLALRVVQNGYTGWYLRVLQEGQVSPDDSIELLNRPEPTWTIARANEVMHHQKDDRDAASELAAVVLLSESWRLELTKRL